MKLRSTAAVLLLLFPVTWELAIGEQEQEQDQDRHRYLRHHARGSRLARSHLPNSISKSDEYLIPMSVPIPNANAIPFELEPTKSSGRLFLSPNHTVVLAQIGTTATMHCEVVADIGESTVTWIRRTDYQLLTVGLTTYSSDDRFFTAHGKNPQDWTLHLRFATDKDAGLYECQISTHPPTSLFVELQLVEAHADIVGGPDKIVKSGSSLRLTCVLRRSTEPPTYVFWYHGARMINFDLGGGAAVRHGRQTSELVIPRAQKQHAGNYSCVPSNARPASVNVHVLQVEKPAAMQHGSKNSSNSNVLFRFRHYILTTLGTLLISLLLR